MDEKAIAFYIRLSKEDREKPKGSYSNSIRNQRILLYQYIRAHREFHSKKILEFIDDGYTGTNFNRPQFQRMAKLAGDGKIDCIICKDFSRFGRNYLEAGDYMEQIFPLYDVRLIFVTDHYDSRNRQETAGFSNLLAELYSRELSQKVKTILREKQKKGEYLSKYPLYGYRHDPTDPKKLAIDEESARVVEMIFEMRIKNMSMKEIADKLNQKKIITPQEYADKKYGRKPRTKPNGWNRGMIGRILKEERYTGTMLSHRYEAEELKGKGKRVDKEKWIRVNNTHEAIISREAYGQVNPDII